MAKSLSERLKTGLESGRTTIETRRALVEETTAERDRCLALFEQTSAEATDPLLDDEHRDEAARTADRSKRLAEGYTNAIAKLEALIVAAEESDKHKAAEAEKAAALAERDQIAEELATDGRAALETLIAILAKIEPNTARMNAAGLREADAEAKARGIPSNWYIGPSPIAQLIKMKIPEWSGPGRQWPIDRGAQRLAEMHRLEGERARRAQLARTPEALAAKKAQDDLKYGMYRLSTLGDAQRFSYTPRDHARQITVRIWRDPHEAEILHSVAEAARAAGLIVEPVEAKAA